MSNYDEVKEALERAQSLINDAYDEADSAESSASSASNSASRAGDAIGTALEELSNYQPYDANDLERLIEIQFALVEVLGVNARRINSLVDGNGLTYTEGNYLRVLHQFLTKVTTRGNEDILVYAERVTEFNATYEDDLSLYGRKITFYTDKKKAEEVGNV